MMRKNLFFFFTGIILTYFCLSFVQNSVKNQTENHFSSDLISTTQEIKDILDQNMSAPSTEKLSDSIIHAFVSSYGDQFTQYFSPEELVSFQTMIEGDFE
ncbi:hypothetical protein H6768_04605 [Candidatus Peribacteria bacterium]|nr:hypothetical protein [Candidatus Peribacteria bacterium]